jgi:hypothetical protein
MKAIGSFFGLEQQLTGSRGIHAAAPPLSLGRAASWLILDQLQPERVWIPFLTWKVLSQTLKQLRIPCMAEDSRVEEKLLAISARSTTRPPDSLRQKSQTSRRVHGDF